MRICGVCLGVGLSVLLLSLLLRDQSREPAGPRVTDVARALHFEDHGGRFVARAPGANLLVTPSRCTLQAAQGDPLMLEIVGANEAARATGRDPLAHKVHYLRGRDRNRWRTNVATYGKVAIDAVYPGVDLLYYGNERRLEYDFIVAPGTDPACIALRVTGAEHVAIDPAGDLVARGPDGELRQRRPVVYQEIDGAHVRRDGEYALRADGTIGFEIGEYDRTRPLVIDPVVAFATYFGGSGNDVTFSGTATDAAGNLYTTGWTSSLDFPTESPLQDSFAGPDDDVFVAKFAPDGTLLYSTYLGGTRDDSAWDIALDPLGNICVTGQTTSVDFPGTENSPIQSVYNSSNDTFLVKLTPSGDAVIWATYYGLRSFDRAEGIAIDSSGAIYLIGVTASPSLPFMTPDSIQSERGGGTYDAWVAKFDFNGTQVLYTTFLGGSEVELGRDIAVDAEGCAYAVGTTGSPDYPVTANGRQRELRGFSDGFLTKINPGGTAVVFSTYFGGSGNDSHADVEVDAARNIFICGSTSSTDFPGADASPIQAIYGGDPFDVTVFKLDPTGTSIFYATYLGGSASEGSLGMTIDATGHAYVVGGSQSGAGFPFVDPALPIGAQNAFLVKIDPAGTSIIYATPFGGSDIDVAGDVDLGLPGFVYVAGFTRSTDFVTVNPSQASFGGGDNDTFVALIAEDEPPVIELRALDAETFAACGATLNWATGKSAEFDVVATAALTGVGTSLTASLIVAGAPAALPTGASFDTTTGRFEWTPADAEEGTFTFSFEATDDFGLRTVCTLTLITSFDRDGDSLRDLWELDGYTASNGEFVDLPTLGADVAHKDLFVYLDYMQNAEYDHRPIDLGPIVAAFRNAPVDNPDGTIGITLHVLTSPVPIAYRPTEGAVQPFIERLGTGAGVASYRWTRPAGDTGPEIYFDDLKRGDPARGIAEHFPAELAAVSRYGILAHRIGDLPESGISRGLPSSNFIVSLGAFIDETDPAPRRPSSTLQAGTFMHEVGHGLGLRHGGGDETNYKPNYLSVMNYSFQKGLRKNGGIAFDFSRVALPTIAEGGMDEAIGIGDWPESAAGYSTTWFRGFGGLAEQRWTEAYVAGLDTPVDWDMDGNNGEDGVATSINRDFSKTALSSFNDWGNINFKGGTIGAGIPPPLPEVTETGEMDVETAEQLKPAPVDGFAARSGRGSVRLNWNPAGLRGDVTYKVFRKLQGAADFAEIGTTTSTLFSDRRVTRRQTYVYTVTMVDGLGVESLTSTELTVRVR